ncbi:PST family polysaccharide transporter [Rathayibacter sp. PhB179]|nr:PST family polysaccharide transporter [Rathayibacter sp. PhB192]TCM30135.1 PST family polysaccharide transporter [Rathayibacter sp. PhB179]
MGKVRTDYDYRDDDSPGGGARNVRYNILALVGRQGQIIVFSVILARILGPASYGVVAQANVYMAFAALLLDQGLTPALISRKKVDRTLVGAASSINIGLAFLLGAATIPLAGPVADFLQTPQLVVVLPVMAIGLLVKGFAIVPRMLLMRMLRFKVIAVAETVSAAVGGVSGVVLALTGFDFWSIVVQLMVTDAVALIVMYVAARPPLPNLALGTLRDTMNFGIKVFAGNLLSFGSRNIDNLLVGKLFGATDLALYSLAYRVLLTPVQMIGQAVTRVLFPALARVRDVPGEGARLIQRSTATIAFISFPLMFFIAVASYDGIQLILGEAWIGAVPVLAVLAVTGARQAVTSVNAPVLLGYARADIHLRFNILASVVQISGIIIGSFWGMLGVAVGYTIAGIALMPVILLIQRRLAALPVRRQLGAFLPAMHAATWAAGSYLLLYLIPLYPAARIAVGLPLFLGVYSAVMVVVHRAAWRTAIGNALAVIGR